MKKILIIAMLTSAILFTNGCASYMVAKDSARQIAMRKAIASNNERAIEVLENGGKPGDAGISVGLGEAIVERPFLQTGAAVVDAGVGYLGYLGVKEMTGDGNSNSEEDSSAGRDNTQITVNGDGNTVQVRGDENNTGGIGGSL